MSVGDSCAMRILGLILALAIVLVACGDDNGGGSSSSSGSSGGGNSQVCSAVSDVKSSVTKVQDLGSSSTLSEVTNALSGVEQAGSQLASAIQSAPSPDLSGLQSSVQSLENALKAVPSSSTSKPASMPSARRPTRWPARRRLRPTASVAHNPASPANSLIAAIASRLVSTASEEGPGVRSAGSS